MNKALEKILNMRPQEYKILSFTNEQLILETYEAKKLIFKTSFL